MLLIRQEGGRDQCQLCFHVRSPCIPGFLPNASDRVSSKVLTTPRNNSCEGYGRAVGLLVWKEEAPVHRGHSQDLRVTVVSAFVRAATSHKTFNRTNCLRSYYRRAIAHRSKQFTTEPDGSQWHLPLEHKRRRPKPTRRHRRDQAMGGLHQTRRITMTPIEIRQYDVNYCGGGKNKAGYPYRAIIGLRRDDGSLIGGPTFIVTQQQCQTQIPRTRMVIFRAIIRGKIFPW
jgi:hypothetical protein